MVVEALTGKRVKSRELSDKIGGTKDGASFSAAAVAMKEYGLLVQCRHGVPRVSTLRAALRAGALPIVSIRGLTGPHAVVVVGVDHDDSLTIQDPSIFGFFRIPQLQQEYLLVEPGPGSCPVRHIT